MSTDAPYIGIDFGTTFSSMAWYNPGNNPPYSGRAEIIRNAEDGRKVPSVVYFGERETLVGDIAEKMIEDASVDQATREEVFQRTVKSIKRDLLAPPQIALPGGRSVRPVEVAAEIIKKLKRDAEDGVFHRKVSRAVITCPAQFNAVERQVIQRAGLLAGFEEVVLLEEPVAGALAYARSGLEVGQHVLVYDLGGGTFDLAVLDNVNESFHVAMEPKGMNRCGGDDFDMALYYHCDEIAREKLGRPVSLTGTVDLKFLRDCRERKQNLSGRERVTVSSLLSGGAITFSHDLDREKFHELISDYVETTVRLTEAIVTEAEDGGHKVDTVVLIGGSSRVRLVRKMLSETLPVAPLTFHERDVAVALGAAHYAHILWGSKEVPPPPPPTPVEPTPLEQYEKAVEAVSGERLSKLDIDQLKALAKQLGLSHEQAAEVERRVLDATIEVIYEGQLEEYRKALSEAWTSRKLSRAETDRLSALAQELKVGEEAPTIERRVLGVTMEEILPLQYRNAVTAAWDRLDNLAGELGVSGEQATYIELEVLKEFGRSYLREAEPSQEHKYDQAIQQYRATVEEVWRKVRTTKTFSGLDLNALRTKARELGLRREVGEDVEREVMGANKEDVLNDLKLGLVGSRPPKPTTLPDENLSGTNRSQEPSGRPTRARPQDLPD